MTPLFKKLNLGSAKTILVFNAPPSFEPFLAELIGVQIQRQPTADQRFRFALGFARNQRERDQACSTLVAATEGDAILWIAYPKGTSKRYRSDFNRDDDWIILGAAGFEPVRQVSIDLDWSALRFRRVEFIKRLTRHDSMRISTGHKD